MQRKYHSNTLEKKDKIIITIQFLFLLDINYNLRESVIFNFKSKNVFVLRSDIRL